MLMHYVLDLLKRAHIKVNVCGSNAAVTSATSHAALKFAIREFEFQQVTFFVISSYVLREGGKQACFSTVRLTFARVTFCRSCSE